MKTLLLVLCTALSTPCYAFDFEVYSRQKAAGLVSFEDVENGRQIVSKRFDPHTGVALPDERDLIDLRVLNAEIAHLEQRLANLKTLRTDATAR